MGSPSFRVLLRKQLCVTMGHILMLVDLVTAGSRGGEEQLTVTKCGLWAGPSVDHMACPVSRSPLSCAQGKQHPKKRPKAQGGQVAHQRRRNSTRTSALCLLPFCFLPAHDTRTPGGFLRTSASQSGGIGTRRGLQIPGSQVSLAHPQTQVSLMGRFLSFTSKVILPQWLTCEFKGAAHCSLGLHCSASLKAFSRRIWVRYTYFLLSKKIAFSLSEQSWLRKKK